MLGNTYIQPCIARQAGQFYIIPHSRLPSLFLFSTIITSPIPYLVVAVTSPYTPEMAHLRLPTMATPAVPISGRLESNCECTGPSDLSHHFNRVTRERTASAIKSLYKYFQVPEMMNLAGGTLGFVYCLRIKMIVSLVC